jgi:ribosomal protein L12E/L44/L45/RPP1/RPP2
MVMMMFLGAGIGSAATIDLNDGRVVQGDIIKQDNKSIQVNVDGVTMTYYADEIKNVDGKPLAPAPVAPPAAVAPASVAQPEAVANPVIAPVLAPVATPIDPDKKILILKFIDVFGTRQALTNNFNAMLAQIAKDKPNEAKTIRERVKVDEIIERLLPVYDRNFTSEDLNAFIAFYGSAEGQKLIKTIPELMKESVGESIKYMQEKFPESKQAQK